MKEGYVTIYRSLMDSRIFNNPDLLQMWIYLLLEANFKDTYSHEVLVPRGSLITGRLQISKNLKINPSKTERLLKKLEIGQEIEQQTTNKFRIIKIKNYDKYQISDSISNNKRTTSEQQANNKRTLYNKDNKDNKDNNKKEIYKEKRNNFIIPSVEDIESYITSYSFQKKLRYVAIEQGQQIHDFYQSKGWMVGKNKMKDWKAATRNWLGNIGKFKSNNNNQEGKVKRDLEFIHSL